MKTVGQPIRKKDAMALVTGQPVIYPMISRRRTV